ncbi:hypothetical protein Y032_0005g2690 [Ancylostoma ceylanicum]|uniref:Uncharacterized protein n=1 Tax=Ancylostoma ceylanicum TaxID=53326 RepID=A0A016VSH9_9BILA|nr:hypothetical protein Y032_0005g2690 [Ancylostoma ceylanicum]
MVTWSAGKRGCSAGNRGRLWIADRCGGLVGADSLYIIAPLVFVRGIHQHSLSEYPIAVIGAQENGNHGGLA